MTVDPLKLQAAENFAPVFEEIRADVCRGLFSHDPAQANVADLDQRITIIVEEKEKYYGVHRLALLPFLSSPYARLQERFQSELTSPELLSSPFLKYVMVALYNSNNRDQLTYFKSKLAKIGTECFDIAFSLQSLDKRRQCASREHALLLQKLTRIKIMPTLADQSGLSASRRSLLDERSFDASNYKKGGLLDLCTKLRSRGYYPKDYVKASEIDELLSLHLCGQAGIEIGVQESIKAYSYFGCTKKSLGLVTRMLTKYTLSAEVLEFYNRFLKVKLKSVTSATEILYNLIALTTTRLADDEIGFSSSLAAFFESCLVPAPYSELLIDTSKAATKIENIPHPPEFDASSFSVRLTCMIYASRRIPHLTPVKSKPNKNGQKTSTHPPMHLFTVQIANESFTLSIHDGWFECRIGQIDFANSKIAIAEVTSIFGECEQSSWKPLDWEVKYKSANCISFKLNGREVRNFQSPKKQRNFLITLSVNTSSYSLVFHRGLAQYRCGDVVVGVDNRASETVFDPLDNMLVTKWRDTDDVDLSEMKTLVDVVKWRSTRYGVCYNALVEIGGLNALMLLLARFVDKQVGVKDTACVLKVLLKTSKMFSLKIDFALLKSLLHICQPHVIYVQILFDYVTDPGVLDLMMDCSIWRGNDEVWQEVLKKLESLAESNGNLLPKDKIDKFLLSVFGLPAATVSQETVVMIIKLLQVLIGYPPEHENIKRVFGTVQALLPNGCHDQDKNTEYFEDSLSWLSLCTNGKVVKEILHARGVRPKQRPNTIALSTHIEVGTSVSTDTEQFSVDHPVAAVPEGVTESDSSLEMPEGSQKRQKQLAETALSNVYQSHNQGRLYHPTPLTDVMPSPVMLHSMNYPQTQLLVKKPYIPPTNYLVASLLDLTRNAVELISSLENDAKLFDIVHIFTLVSLSGAECAKVRIAAFRLLALLCDRANPEKRNILSQRAIVSVATHRLKYRGIKTYEEAEMLYSGYVKLLLSDFNVDDLSYLPFEYFPLIPDDLRIQSTYAFLVFTRELCKNRNSENAVQFDRMINRCFQLINLLFERSALLAKQLIEYGLTLTIKMAFSRTQSHKLQKSPKKYVQAIEGARADQLPNLCRCVFLVVLKCIYSADELYKTFEDVMYTLCISQDSRLVVYDSIIQLLAQAFGGPVMRLINVTDHEQLEYSQFPGLAQDTVVSEDEITSRIFKLLRRSVNIPVHVLITQQLSAPMSSSMTNLTERSLNPQVPSVEYQFPLTLLKLLWNICKKNVDDGEHSAIYENLVAKFEARIIEITRILLIFLVSTRSENIAVRVKTLELVQEDFSLLSHILKKRVGNFYYFIQVMLYYNRSELTPVQLEFTTQFLARYEMKVHNPAGLHEDGEIYDKIDQVIAEYDMYLDDLADVWRQRVDDAQTTLVNRVVAQYRSAERQVQDAIKMLSLELHNIRVQASVEFEDCFLLPRNVVNKWKQLLLNFTHENAVLHDPEIWSNHWCVDPTLNIFSERNRLKRSFTNFLEKRYYLKSHSTPTEESVSTGHLSLSRRSSIRDSKRLTTVKYLKFFTQLPVKAPRSRRNAELIQGGKSSYFTLREDCYLHILEGTIAGRIEMKRMADFTFTPNDVDLIEYETHYKFSSIDAIMKRTYSLHDCGIEIFLVGGKSMFFSFKSHVVREEIWQNFGNIRQKPLPTQEWLDGRMTNFQYLMSVNFQTRTYNDLMQYPVFPYVLSDYSSTTLDLKNPESFRNLKRPIAVQEDSMIPSYSNKFEYLRTEYLERMNETPCNGDPDMLDNLPPYHYSSLYSNSGIVLHFLVRVQPFTRLFLDYQDNNFDIPDRSFHTMETTYKLSSYASMTDVKELIPEFYFWPEFLLNTNLYNFGYRQCNELVNHVNLPAWAEGNVRIFIKTMRQALESRHVRENLNSWVDLIFGHLQRPLKNSLYSDEEGIVKSVNCYHPACYKSDLTSTDPLKAKALLTMVKTYGQIPKQIFPSPHVAFIETPLSEETRNYNTFGKITNVQYGSFVGMGSKRLNRLIAIASKTIGYSIHELDVTEGESAMYALPEHVAVSNKALFIIPQSGDPTSIVYKTPIQNAGVTDVRKVRVEVTQPVYPGLKVTVMTAHEDRMLVGTTCGQIFVGTKKFRILTGHTCSVKKIVACCQQNVVVSLDESGKIIIWDAADYGYIRSMTAPHSNLRKSTICVFPRTGDIVHSCEERLLENGTSEKSIKLRMWNINGGLDGARQLTGVELNSMCVSDMDEGTNMNILYIGCTQADSYAIIICSSWDLRTLKILSLDTQPLFLAWAPSHLYVADAKKLFLYVDAEGTGNRGHASVITPKGASSLVSRISILPFWLLQPNSSSSLKKVMRS